MTSGTSEPPAGLRALPPPPPSRRARIFLWLFSVAMVLVAGSAFLFKLIEFFLTATNKGADALASFLIPVLNYLLVAAGFFCLFLWAWLSGQLRDVESAKYRMLELQAQIDAREARARTGGRG